MEFHNLAEKIFDKRYLNKFKKWCGNYKIYMAKKDSETDTSILFYISNNLIEDFKELVTEKVLGYISIVIDYEEKDLTITFVNVTDKFKGKGIGTFLMILSSSYVKSLKDSKINKVFLDDDSDNAWDMKNNLYIKLGFKYINPEPESEMICDIETLFKKWNLFIKKTPELKI